MMSDIDWTQLAKYPPQTIECVCGAVYRSHAKFIGAIRLIVTQLPCPNCGKTSGHVRAARTDPENWSIR